MINANSELNRREIREIIKDEDYLPCYIVAIANNNKIKVISRSSEDLNESMAWLNKNGIGSYFVNPDNDFYELIRKNDQVTHEQAVLVIEYFLRDRELTQVFNQQDYLYLCRCLGNMPLTSLNSVMPSVLERKKLEINLDNKRLRSLYVYLNLINLNFPQGLPEHTLEILVERAAPEKKARLAKFLELVKQVATVEPEISKFLFGMNQPEVK